MNWLTGLSNMKNEQVQKRIDELMKTRNRHIESGNHWEANKIGEQIRALRHQLPERITK